MRTAILTAAKVPHATSGLVWSIGEVCLSLIRFLARCYVISTERHALARLDERLIKDVGCDPALVRCESDRGFWQGHRERWPN